MNNEIMTVLRFEMFRYNYKDLSNNDGNNTADDIIVIENSNSSSGSLL
jgi:hypothetical protein